MNGRGLLRLFLLIAVVLKPLGYYCAAAEQDLETKSQAAKEKQECIENLRQIFTAIQAYEVVHKDLPNWLSDLVPDFLSNANVLICPVCRRTGRTEERLLADPKLSSSYLFEFCPVSLGGKLSNHTRREWKRRQMGLLGSVVPIVRCRNHGGALNLAFDGRIYEGPPMWEMAYTNRISAAELTAARLFANDADAPAENPAPASRHFAARQPNTPKELLDLSPFYNAMLEETWHGRSSIGNDLASLPTGVQTFGDVKFDIRGIVQLESKSGSSTNFPPEINGIPVHQKCQRVHFLHAAGFGKVADQDRQIGSYIVHYATNRMRLEIPIIYGQDVRDWHTMPGEPPAPKELQVVWTGQNAVSRSAGQSLRLFLTTWTNLLPGFEIDSIDFTSSMANPAPFLLGITVEPQ